MITFDPDKFGFYQSGSLKTYRKWEAIQAQDRTGQFPEWHFNRRIFDGIDWYREPDQDLWSLYRQRCRQIRDSYDYCVIFYSGGSDSDNMLRAWIDADCKLDEIATFKIASARLDTGDFDWAIETPFVVEPMIQRLQQQGMDFVYREIDSVDHTMLFLQRHIDDYAFQANGSFSPNNVMKSALRETIVDYREIIDAGKKLCFIWGIDKPQIRYDQASNAWYMDFIDMIDNCVPPTVQENFANGWYDELFYWTPDLALIPVKQAHVLRRWCMTVHDPKYYQDRPSIHGYNRKRNQYLTTSAAKIALYPKWDPATLVAPKPRAGSVRPDFGYLVYSERDRWFFDSNHALVARYEDQVTAAISALKKHSRFDWIPIPGSGNQSLITNCRQSHRFA